MNSLTQSKTKIKLKPPKIRRLNLEKLLVKRVTGIEPVSSAWKAEVLPLHNTRIVQTNHCPWGWWCREHAFIMAIRLPEASA